MRKFWTYIVASQSGTLYVGFTNNLYKRVFEHKNKLLEGFTRKYDCNRLVWYEQWSGPLQGIRREKQIKGWTRARKIALIEQSNTRWTDLAETWGRRILMPNQRCDELVEKPGASRVKKR
ncbi:MAG: GIY-YIG nuclease family protein [Candidatus Korobacteraceae bacterium]|jgi:putative endonuclease